MDDDVHAKIMDQAAQEYLAAYNDYKKSVERLSCSFCDLMQKEVIMTGIARSWDLC